MSLLSTQDPELWIQFLMKMKSDKQRRRNQRHDCSNPMAGMLDGSCLEGTVQTPCLSPHLTDKKIKGWRNVATCPRHQLARGTVWSFGQATQSLTQVPLPFHSSQSVQYDQHSSLVTLSKLPLLSPPNPCPPPPDCQSLFCMEGDRWVLTNEN